MRVLRKWHACQLWPVLCLNDRGMTPIKRKRCFNPSHKCFAICMVALVAWVCTCVSFIPQKRGPANSQQQKKWKKPGIRDRDYIRENFIKPSSCGCQTIFSVKCSFRLPHTPRALLRFSEFGRNLPDNMKVGAGWFGLLFLFFSYSSRFCTPK